ncbi:hypothetical protein EVAR_61504_1 [Eumeta japonica]|uniref:Uncharacterized protein n=1 Tax=Eumeta variegata TaxID=151549 RepID=A0A4C2A228_EUMVA|nr:hypothetical protein EVAR_61504_1 [Eumeta japonica]
MIPALLFCEPERRMRGKGTTVELSVRKFNNTKPSRPGQGWKEPKRRKSIGIRGYSFRAARRGGNKRGGGGAGKGRRTPVWATRISIADVPVRSRRRPTRPLTRLLHEY